MAIRSAAAEPSTPVRFELGLRAALRPGELGHDGDRLAARLVRLGGQPGRVDLDLHGVGFGLALGRQQHLVQFDFAGLGLELQAAGAERRVQSLQACRLARQLHIEGAERILLLFQIVSVLGRDLDRGIELGLFGSDLQRQRERPLRGVAEPPGGEVHIAEGKCLVRLLVAENELAVADLHAGDVELHRLALLLLLRQQIVEVELAVLAPDQRRLDAIQLDRVHHQLLGQQRHHRHRHPHTFQRREFLVAFRFPRAGCGRA
ncbi:MAG: hypothetical protein MZW92_64830 [Comamonadaceae bacterium]|nr:hypothetical protein [Comamonadaceae bacterium]